MVELNFHFCLINVINSYSFYQFNNSLVVNNLNVPFTTK